MDMHRPGPGLVDVLFRTSSVAMDNMTDTSIEQMAGLLHQYRANAISAFRIANPGADVPGEKECQEERLCGVCYFPVPTQQLEMYVVNVDLDQLTDKAMREEVETVPTNFNLSGKQVDLMISAGRNLVKDSECFQLFLSRTARQQPLR
jgi:hypothetical protein